METTQLYHCSGKAAIANVGGDECASMVKYDAPKHEGVVWDFMGCSVCTPAQSRCGYYIYVLNDGKNHLEMWT